MRKLSAETKRRLRNAALVLAALEVFCYVGPQMPGPLTLAAVGAYNGIQWARAVVPTPARVWRRHKAAGPPPDPRVVSAGNDFGLRLFRRLCDDEPGMNFFFSPYSLNAAMCLTYNGAGGDTKTGMESTLALKGIPLDDVNAAQHRMAQLLNYSDPKITVASANSLWADARAPMSASFMKTARDAYNANAENVTLTNPSTPDRINRWIKDHTEGRIAGGVQPFTRMDRLVLANALYFHGVWQQKFDKENTRLDEFHLTPDTEKTVPMMWRHGGCSMLYDRAPEGRFTAARLPYGDGSMAMYVFVPDHGYDLPSFLKRVNRANWDKWMAGFHGVEGSIGLPKMCLRFDRRMEDTLNAMGMRLDKENANLTPMGSDQYYVSQVRQQAILDVDEEGTTAAAITIEIARAKGRSPVVVADRPFFLAIRDDRSGAILFAGAIYDPQPDGT